jgi:pimeloyl-ACP methyl ester carboxylesterase
MNPMDAIVPVVLPTMTWGNLASEKTALMVHGLGSSAATCWRVMEALASDGYCAVAPDLRGHGSAPRTTRYRIADFAADISELSPPRGGSWDVVIGHSIGAASAVVAQAQKPSWAKQLVLLDPALHIDDADPRRSIDQSKTRPQRSRCSSHYATASRTGTHKTSR